MCQLAAVSRAATALTACPAPTSAVSSSSAAGTLACPASNTGVHGRGSYTGGGREGACPTLGVSLLGREGEGGGGCSCS